jgi:hypothetical protein
MISNARFYVGEACLRVASYWAKAGSLLLGKPYTRLALEAGVGSRELILEQQPPRGITRGLRLLGDGSDEVVRIVSVRGDRIAIDRPIAQQYAKGAAVKFLI